MRVLVTGGAGFIGSHIVDALLLRGHQVSVMDDMSSGKKENIPIGVQVWDPGNILYRGEESPRSIVDLVVSAFRPDVICHQAAQPSLRRSIDDPAHDAMVNIVGTINVIQAAKQCGAHVVFASTSAVYDPAGGVFIESSPITPNLPYGIAKATAERYLVASGVSCTILRYGNVYGPRQVQVGENQLIPHCLAYLMDGKPFVINGDGHHVRDFVYVGDVARANVLAIECQPKDTFNIGTGTGVSVNQVCRTLADLLCRGVPFQNGPAKDGEARHVILDSSKAKYFGWQAATPLADGLRETAAWWKERQ